MNNDKTCKTCRYWEESWRGLRYNDEGLAVCRRNPPAYVHSMTVPDGEPRTGEWPETSEDDWCGEHKPIKAEKPEGMSDHTWHEYLREQDAIDRAQAKEST